MSICSRYGSKLSTITGGYPRPCCSRGTMGPEGSFASQSPALNTQTSISGRSANSVKVVSAAVAGK
ncbi:hypothetical protein D3C87_2061520 [compost metagenome]